MLSEMKASKEFSNPKLEINNKLTILEHLSTKPVVKESRETVIDEFQKYDKDLRTLTYRVLLEKFNIDPALSGSVILTTVTDIVGFVAFLGLGTLLLM